MPLNHALWRRHTDLAPPLRCFLLLLWQRSKLSFPSREAAQTTEQLFIVFFFFPLSARLSNRRLPRAFNLQQVKGFIHSNAISEEQPGPQLQFVTLLALGSIPSREDRECSLGYATHRCVAPGGGQSHRPGLGCLVRRLPLGVNSPSVLFFLRKP